MVIPSITILFTLEIPDSGEEGRAVGQPCLTITSVDLFGISLRLLALAQAVICDISAAIE